MPLVTPWDFPLRLLSTGHVADAAILGQSASRPGNTYSRPLDPASSFSGRTDCHSASDRSRDECLSSCARSERSEFQTYANGDYASTSEVVRDALRQWKMRRAIQIQEIAALKSDIDKGLADVAAGRVKDFDKKKIVERGRKLLASRSSSD
jgi:antitoxin ParD1/3/4